MVQRCIMIFPDFENMSIIDEIREQYDPLSEVIRPHITLVFPFYSEITKEQLETHIKSVIQDFRPFEIIMSGITANVEAEASYLFLNFTKGINEVYKLSQNLYTGILAEYQSEIYKKRYCPHITVGKLNKNEDYKDILSNIRNKDAVFETSVNSISVEVIGANDSSSAIETQIKL